MVSHINVKSYIWFHTPVKFQCEIKEYPHLSEKLIKILFSFQTKYLCVRPDFIHIL